MTETRGYKSFPPEYFTILDRVEKLAPGQDFRIGPFTKGGATTGRRSFYRFRKALAEEANKGDQFADTYVNVGNTLKLELLELPQFQGPGQWWIVFGLNPLVSAVRRLEAAR